MAVMKSVPFETRKELALTSILTNCSNDDRTWDLSMPGYIEQALDEYMLEGDGDDRRALREALGDHISVPPAPTHEVVITLR